MTKRPRAASADRASAAMTVAAARATAAASAYTSTFTRISVPKCGDAPHGTKVRSRGGGAGVTIAPARLRDARVIIAVARRTDEPGALAGGGSRHDEDNHDGRRRAGDAARARR